MATSVTQVSPVEPVLASNADYAYFTEYQIPGQSSYQSSGATTYVLDSNTSTVYVFANGQLAATSGSWSAFQAYLVLNPVTATVPPGNQNVPLGPIPNPFPAYSAPTLPATPTSVFAQETNDLLSEVVTLLRAMHLALTALACEGGLAEDSDFSPNSLDFDSINTSRSYQ